MNTAKPAAGGRFRRVPYFNGGLFSTIESVDLTTDELLLIGGEGGASTQDWSKINPAIFGTLFQYSMDTEARHAYGAHFTSEADILRVVTPTIVRPWQERIESTSTMRDLLALRRELLQFRVLDPACGSGNFLYVSYRELVRLEISLLTKLKAEFSEAQFYRNVKSISVISPRQFYGIDRDSFGVELAKVTLMLAKKLAMDEAYKALERDQIELPLDRSEALPLDNLDSNFICNDALFVDWPEVNAIVGNPPYQSKNKMQQELGRAYVNKVREQYPDVDGRADYCVYWFRCAHDHLKEGQRAGLVGTNTVRQNYSRTGGLDYVIGNRGTITEAVSTMKWSGEAAVDVSIVNWIKASYPGKKRLYIQEGSNPSEGWRFKDFDTIGPALSFEADVTSACTIQANAAKGGCFQGQTHGHESFLLSIEQAEAEITADPKNKEILFPFLIANELIGRKDSLPERYVIDFYPRDQLSAQMYPAVFEHIRQKVLPDRQKAADEEEKRNKEAEKTNPNAAVNHHHRNFLNSWWILSYPREDMILSIRKLARYIVCGQVTKRPIFEFISPNIRPNAALIVFPYEDDYSFGILQSSFHWKWFVNRCSTLTGRYRYTSNTVFDSFPWPQNPALKTISIVATEAQKLRHLRRELMSRHDLSLRDLYRSLELPGKHPLKDAQATLDEAVQMVYNMPKSQDVLGFLFDLNHKLAEKEKLGQPVTGPGYLDLVQNHKDYMTSDCVHIP